MFTIKNLDSPILDVRSNPILQEGKKYTLRDALADCIAQVQQDDNYRRKIAGRVAKKIMDEPSDSVELTNENAYSEFDVLKNTVLGKSTQGNGRYSPMPLVFDAVTSALGIEETQLAT